MTEVNHRRDHRANHLKAPTRGSKAGSPKVGKTAHRGGYLPSEEKPWRYKNPRNSVHIRTDPLVGTVCSKGVGFAFNGGRAGQMRAVAGSKKFVNSRIRERERIALRRIAREDHDE